MPVGATFTVARHQKSCSPPSQWDKVPDRTPFGGGDCGLRGGLRCERSLQPSGLIGRRSCRTRCQFRAEWQVVPRVERHVTWVLCPSLPKETRSWIESQLDGGAWRTLRTSRRRDCSDSWESFFEKCELPPDVAVSDGDFGTFWDFDVLSHWSVLRANSFASDQGHWVAVCIAPGPCQLTTRKVEDPEGTAHTWD